MSTRSGTTKVPLLLAFFVPVTLIRKVWLPAASTGLVNINVLPLRLAAKKSTIVSGPPSIEIAPMPCCGSCTPKKAIWVPVKATVVESPAVLSQLLLSLNRLVSPHGPQCCQPAPLKVKLASSTVVMLGPPGPPGGLTAKLSNSALRHLLTSRPTWPLWYVLSVTAATWVPSIDAWMLVLLRFSVNVCQVLVPIVRLPEASVVSFWLPSSLNRLQVPALLLRKW